MARSVILLLLGAAVGGAGVWFTAAPSRPEPAAADVAAPRQAPPAAAAIATGPAAASGGYASERLAVYERVASLADRAQLEQSIREAAAEPPTWRRDLALEALLGRLAELDPAVAVQLARDLYLQAHFIEPLFASWAASDADAAIAGLAVIRPPARQRGVALAVLHALPADTDAVARVAAALPAPDRFSFELDVLTDRAGRDPAGALAAALDSGYTQIQLLRVLEQVVPAAMQIDPRATVAQLALIGDAALQRSALTRALDAWAVADPAGAFTWIEAADADLLPNSIATYQALADADRQRLFALVERLPPQLESAALRGLLQSTAVTDPAAAVALLDELVPPSAERARLAELIAFHWASADPETALTWARGLSPRSPAVVRGVFEGSASRDFDRAAELLLNLAPELGRGGSPSDLTEYVTALFARGSPTAGSAERVLDRIAALDAPWARASVGTAVTAWAIREPEAALDWALGRATEVDPGLFTRIAVRTAQQDIDLAVGTIDRLPPAQRAEWLSGVAETLALRDPERAVELVGRYRGQAGHLPALAAVANQLALSDPTRAAALLGDARALPAADAQLAAVTVSVAWSWAGRDPRAAADWVAGLDDLPGQPDAVSAIAQTWAPRDPDATRRWLGQLDSGAARDAGLESFLLARAQSGDFDAALLASFSSAQQAEDSAGHAIARIGRNDPDRARQLVNVHITDASVRARTLAEIGQPGAAGAGVSISNDGIRVR